MPGNLTNIDPLLKEYYAETIKEQLYTDNVILKYADKVTEGWDGRRIAQPIHVGRNVGIGPRAEAGTLPSAGQQSHAVAYITACYLYARIQVTGPAMATSKNTFVDALTMELDGAVTDLKNELEIELSLDGTGRRAFISASGSSSSSVLVQNRFARPGYNGARYFSVGQDITAGTIADVNASFGSRTITALSISTNPATLNDTVTVALSTTVWSGVCHIFTTDNVADAASYEIMGLRGAIDDARVANIFSASDGFITSIQSINRLTVTQFNANVIQNSGTAQLADSYLLQRGWDAIYINSGKKPQVIFGEPATLRAVLDSVSSDRRYGTPVFQAGTAVPITYNGIPLEQVVNLPYNELFMIGEGALKWCILKDFGWSDETGAVLNRITDQDVFTGVYRFYGNLGVIHPRACANIRDINIDL